jgi:putative tryptophan/tyrosine transport system substrate-binding protein
MTGFRRRRFLLAAGALLTCSGAQGQARAIHRVAFLSGGRKADTANFYAALVGALRDLGYREGVNLELDERYADYSAERAGQLAADIAARKPDVIVTNGGGIAPVHRLSPPLPIVFLHSGNPVDAGFADSLSRPGRHATGMSLMALDLIAKRVEFLKQIRPKMRRLAFLASPEHAGQQRELAASRAAAEQFGIEVAYHEARTPAELAAALPAVVAGKPDAALLFSDALMVGQRQALAEFFIKHRIPSAAGWTAFPESGHLLSYGPERIAAWRRIAHYVDRILRGARPADIPIELPTVFELVVNRRTAKAMNLALPRQILVRAERIID